MAGLSLESVTRRFGDCTAVDRISLEIAEGEFLALLGPSGCGKTTLLRLIAGFERAQAGTIRFDDETVADEYLHVVPERRRVGMVFQSYALWPHMNVADNVGYPLKVTKMPAADRRERVRAALTQVGMPEYGGRRPAELSGGQRQRVALARCLVMEPRVVLLDEPLANLDVHLREEMQSEFRKFHAQIGATMIYVTHDQAEAMALCDRIAVMNGGRIEQVAAPRDMYARPASAMVAGFVGQGMVVPGEVVGVHTDGRCIARILNATARIRCDDSAPGRALFCLRSRALAFGPPEAGTIAGRVVDTVYRGAMTSVDVQADADSRVTLRLDIDGEAPRVGTLVHVEVRDGWRIPGTPS